METKKAYNSVSKMKVLTVVQVSILSLFIVIAMKTMYGLINIKVRIKPTNMYRVGHKDPPSIFSIDPLSSLREMISSHFYFEFQLTLFRALK